MNAHPLQLPVVYAAAVGTGVARSISSEGVHSDTAAEWIQYCIKAAQEAYTAVIDDPPARELSVTEKLLNELEEKYPDETPEIGFHREPSKPVAGGRALREAAEYAAAMAFRFCLPQLTNRRRVQAYIACIAVGVANCFITAKDGNSLLYPAQLALAAYPKRRANAGRKVETA